ncbi:interferon-induced very large GTPase 1-like isoform X3 [Cololabis saira]|uniref:interferon-induced very large GTPase 1-like isoform X3 n=1 Tax=Cololabis saira TaxID=129043 RepID=UPI002AD3CE14|nr:interferon-induced very large GTPase 1-like isoform X3 [Cololabis saira]
MTMLLKVKYQHTKKYIRLESGFTYLDFIAQVKCKFELPAATELDAFDETNTVVEEDIFSELIEASPDLCLTVRDRIPNADQTEERAADTESDPYDVQHSDTNTEQEMETKSSSAANSDKVMAQLTLVLIGDTNSIEIGPKNLLLDRDEQTNVEQFSSRLYDLCGRHVSVINMLGLPSVDKIPSIQTVHAFILLLQNDLHSPRYRAGMKWLEKAFGERHTANVITVVTHQSDEKCELALTNLEVNDSFSEKRFHTCTRTMMDEKEIIELLEKIDVMVSENNPPYYSRHISEETGDQKEQLDHKSLKEEARTDHPADGKMETAAETKIKETGDAEHSEKKSEIKSDPCETKEKDHPADGKMDAAAETKIKEPGDAEHSEKKSEIKSDPYETKEKDQTEERAADTEIDPHDVQHSDKNTEQGMESKSASAANSDKDHPADGKMEAAAETKIKETGDAEHSEKKSEIKSDPCETKEKDHPADGKMETAAETKIKETGDAEHSEKKSEIKSDPYETKEKDQTEERAADTEIDPHDVQHSDKNTEQGIESKSASAANSDKDHPADGKMEAAAETKIKEPGDAEHSEKKSEIKSDPCETKEKDHPADGKMETAAETKIKETGDAEHSEKKSEIKSDPCETKEKDQTEERAADTEIDPHDVQHSDKNTEQGMESKSASAANSDKDHPADGKMEAAAETKIKEPGDAEHSEKKSEIKSDPCETNEKDHPADGKMETAAETKIKEPGDAEHSEKKSEIMSDPCETKEKGTLDGGLCGNEKKRPRNISEENKKTQRTEFEEVLSRLHLLDRYQHKFSPADLAKICPSVKQSNDTSEKDLAQTFLQKLMMLDYRARYIPVRKDSSEVNQSQSVQVSDSDDTDDSDSDALFSTVVRDQSKQSHVHPMDVQMAVFHCSDSFLKQNMITKLSQCQYALPLLVPDPAGPDIECPLWAFRQINKTWKIRDDSNTVIMKSMPICKANIPMVTFLRLGSLSQSKSQLMNTLINERHNTFFHRNCPGSTKTRHLMDGVAEIAWYCPAGKPDDSFTDCIAFCNLHGDSLSIDKQREILIKMSSVIVVLVPTLKKNESSAVISTLYKSEKPLVVLVDDDDFDVTKMKPQKYKLGLKDRNQSDVCEELKQIIGKVLSGPRTSFQLESIAEVSGVRVDENDPVCQAGKSAAMEISKLTQGMDVSRIKDDLLPCQGQLWHDWSKINKELYHLKGNIEKEKSQREKRLKKLREEQRAVSCRKLIESITKNLMSLSPEVKAFYLKWTQIQIDALSTDDLSLILQEYDQKWSEVLALKNKHDKTALLKKKQTELEQLSKKLQSATFGLEHIFREMGQIYEAHKSQEKQTQRSKTEWDKYPELAADLMISGHPMELMDGDAGHVPLTWISSVVQEVINKLGDQRVFVLSVLGVQSSGKSTMLNAMFGLQFAVSAGRCTRGAYMQLVKLSEEIKEDYILVVDTEGLRALELEGDTTLKHDNELATFVVGLGNLTLINIYGENPAEMQDVLQIVVQAFMRMKKVNLSPSCVFVHQNVTSIAAAEKNMDGRRRLQEKLDKMAQLAAKEEVCDAECFNDVIKFDIQNDVKYFAQLWEGSPPMAPVNPDYSESVQELKNFILSKASASAGITLSHFSSKVKDLWTALMNEHFVFSFKNAQEIATYRRLEVQYGNWTWDLRTEMLTIENQLYPKVEKGQIDKVELSYLSKEMSKRFGEITKNMAVFFDNDVDKEILAQWQVRFEIKIKEFHDEHVSGVKRKLDEVIQQNKARKNLDKKTTDYENNLLQKSKELAHQLKGKAKDEEELKQQFDSVWGGWVTEFTKGTKPIEDINLEEDQKHVLQLLGFDWSLTDESKTSGRYKKLSEAGSYCDYITHAKSHEYENQQPEDDKRTTDKKQKAKKSKHEETKTEDTSYGKRMKVVWNYTKEQWEKVIKRETKVGFEEQQLIRSLIDDVEQKSLEYIQSKPVATQGYSSAYLHKMAHNVKQAVTEFNAEKKFQLQKEFTVDLCLYVFDKAESCILKSHKTYKEKNDALTYLDSKKNGYYNIFRSFCRGNSSAVVFAEMICEKLKVSAVEAACNTTAIHLAGDMRSNFPAFTGNRLDLEKHVLKSLAEKEDFSKFITYITNPRKQVEDFIKEEVKKYIFTEHKDESLKKLQKNVDDIDKLVSQSLFEATEKVKIKKGDIEMWVEEFSRLLDNKLTLDTISCQNFSDINNFDFLKEETEKALKSIKEMKQLSLEEVTEFRQKPDEILIEQLCNCCWERCPFCAAVCTNSVADHIKDKEKDKHSAPFHRPNGVQGWHGRGTVNLVIDFCTTLVVSDRRFYPRHDKDERVPYKQYPTAGERFASWRITADESKLTYWKWFVCRFQKDLEDHYELKFQGSGKIPGDWRNCSKDEAIESLDEMFRL